MKSHELYTEGLHFLECIDFLSWSFIIPKFYHNQRKRIPSNSKVVMWQFCGCPVLPLIQWQRCSIWSPCLFIWHHLLADLVYKEKCIFMQLCPFKASTDVQRGGLKAHWAKQPFPTATNTCSSSGHRGVKRGQWPQLFLRPPVCQLDVEKALGQVFTGQLMGLQCTILVPFKWGKNSEEKIAKRIQAVHPWL